MFAQCHAACSTWAVKDIDCPDAGCYGFAVAMPTTFSNMTHITPPAPSCFANNSDCNACFAPSTVNSGGCQYPTLLSSDFCSTDGSGVRRKVAVEEKKP